MLGGFNPIAEGIHQSVLIGLLSLAKIAEYLHPMLFILKVDLRCCYSSQAMSNRHQLYAHSAILSKAFYCMPSRLPVLSLLFCVSFFELNK